MLAGPGKLIAGFALVLLVVLALFSIYGTTARLHLLGLPFLIVGFGVVYSSYWANKQWVATNGCIEAIERSAEEWHVRYSYSSGGKNFRGSVNRTSRPEVGDSIRLFVNPNRPEEYYVDSPISVFLGMGFMLGGTLVLTSRDLI